MPFASSGGYLGFQDDEFQQDTKCDALFYVAEPFYENTAKFLQRDSLCLEDLLKSGSHLLVVPA